MTGGGRGRDGERREPGFGRRAALGPAEPPPKAAPLRARAAAPERAEAEPPLPDMRPAPDPAAVARRFGAPRAAAVPLTEFVRATAPVFRAPDPGLEKTRWRLLLATAGFALLFGAVVAKLADATLIDPVRPKVAAAPHRADPPATPPLPAASVLPASLDLGVHGGRAMITDRNGEILAVSLPTAGLFANPSEIIDAGEAAHKLVSVLPRLDEAAVKAKLSESTKQFVYLERQITPKEELAINNLGIVGLEFQPTERRHYPLGRVAAQVLGGVDVDGRGQAGVEKYFDERLRTDGAPLRLALDVRVQAVVREELLAAMTEFQAIGAAGIVMDVRTGELIAMVSLPDYDANDYAHAAPDEQVNRAAGRVYEPGSTFKLQTCSMALDDGVVNIWNGFDATSPIHIGRFEINDFEGKHRFLYVPEIIAYSSNIGAAKMAQAAGAERQRAWMGKMGMLSRVPIELPEAAAPLAPPERNWKEAATLTIGFGHGIAVTPLHVVVGTAAVANGGVLLHPTLLLPDDTAPPRAGVRVMQTATSDIMRKLMRLVVTDGFGKQAEVAGYYVGGKTGTAEKISGHGYNHHSRVSAFMGVFPMNAPRYAVYMMLDEPKADASTHGYATAGWVSAPAAGRVIARAAPMLGLLPDTDDAEAIKAALSIPLEPGRPANARAALPAPAAPAPAAPARTPMAHAQPPRQLPGVRPQAVPATAAPAAGRAAAPASPQPTVPLPVGPAPAIRDLRHEARYLVPADAGH
jgi:cell division protein FtsI (penicillin-binding protein 3)